MRSIPASRIKNLSKATSNEKLPVVMGSGVGKMT